MNRSVSKDSLMRTRQQMIAALRSLETAMIEDGHLGESERSIQDRKARRGRDQRRVDVDDFSLSCNH